MVNPAIGNVIATSKALGNALEKSMLLVAMKSNQTKARI